MKTWDDLYPHCYNTKIDRRTFLGKRLASKVSSTRYTELITGFSAVFNYLSIKGFEALFNYHGKSNN